MTTIKLLALVEATTVNAVAKNVLEFHRSSRELHQVDPSFPLVEVSLVTFDRTPDVSGSPNDFVTAARSAGLEVDIIPERGRFDRSVIPALGKIVARRAPDIVVTHSVKSHFVMLRSRLWRQYGWVAFHHGYTTTDRKMRIYNRVDRWSLPKADHVITVCEAFAQELVSKKGVARDRISVQHNAIRPEPVAREAEVRDLRRRLGIGEGERVILAVGRLSKEKAHIDLLDAFKQLRETHPEIKVRLVIVGDGPERGNLETAAASLGINDGVIFTGHVENVQPYYAGADALANPSHSEGSPYVLLEAMAANLPIVATSVGGVPEMLKDEESALLIQSRDAGAMAAALARVVNDRELESRLSSNASALVATRFSPDTYVRSLVEIYRGVALSRDT